MGNTLIYALLALAAALFIRLYAAPRKALGLTLALALLMTALGGGS